MKESYIASILLSIILFSGLSVSAQVGWKWGRGATPYGPASKEMEGFLVVSDRSGGCYTSPVLVNIDSVKFGSFMLRNPRRVFPKVIIARTDAAGNYTWAKISQNTVALPIAMTTDSHGNLYLLGSYNDSAFTLDGVTLHNPMYYYMDFLVKVSPAGSVLWAKNITSAGTDGGYGGICVDNSDNVYFTSAFSGASASIGSSTLVNHDPAGTSLDIFVAKYSPTGNFVWAKSYGTGGNDYQVNIVPSSPGHLCIAGSVPADSSITFGTTVLAGPGNNFYVQLDTNGNISWAKQMPLNVWIKGITNGISGELYVCGDIFSTLTLGSATLILAGGADMFVAKIDLAGNIVWANSAGGNDNDEAYSITADLCGKVWVSGSIGAFPSVPGYTMSFNGNMLTIPTGSFDPMYMAEYDTAGNYITGMTFPSGGDDANGIVVDNSGNFFVSGDYVHSPIIFGLDTLGFAITADTGQEFFFVAKYKYDTAICAVEIALDAPSTTRKTIDNPDIAIYPNPATTECTISLGENFPERSIAALYDITGRLINTYLLSGNNPHISLPELPPGVYLCKITIGDNRVVFKKILLTD